MVGLFSEMMELARLIPGMGYVERELAGAERALLREFRRRVEAIAEDRPAEGTPRSSGTSDGSLPVPSAPQTLAEVMERMLRRSMDQTPSESRHSLFEHVIGELVPDEARILAALADGSTYPLLDVAAPALGNAGRVILRNASNVGRAAGVAEPSLVPIYVTHLLQLGLADTGQEDSDLHDEYEILLTESLVMSAYAEADKAARRSPRIVRGTLRISALGREFWAACQLGKDD
ncbi:MAG TPA: Abi-alpha family protein [Mycobacterium sp.]|nr:Abi-alpha family protein [Mycobacterium sp.]